MDPPIPYLDLRAQIRSIRGELDAAIGRALDDCSFCLGPEVQAFEAEFAAFCGVEHAVGLNSGTSALHIALRLLELGPGDEVITTPFTFIATSWAISYVGARPVYADIDPVTMNLDPAAVEAVATTRTKAILPVHLFGLPCDLDPMLALAAGRNVALIEDAAQAHGARYHGRAVGGFGRMACFSFYPGKNLGACGEGGALVTRDPALAARARSLREHGSTRRYYHDEVGYNYRMEGIQGAVLRVKLRHLANWTDQRRRVARGYRERLADLPLKLPAVVPGIDDVHHLFVVRTPRRDDLKAWLDGQGIGCALHYPLPLHLQRCYEELGYRPGDFPAAEQAARECLSLPIYPELTDSHLDRIAAAIRRFFA